MTTGLTIVTTAKGTIKAQKILEEKNPETKVDIVKETWKCYVPTALSGGLTIGCIIGNAVITNKKITSLNNEIVSLGAALALAEKSFKTYKDHVEEEVGEKKLDKIQKKVYEDELVATAPKEGFVMSTDDDYILCWEAFGKRYFKSTVTDVHVAELNLNQLLNMNGCVSLNDFYDLLEIDRSPEGEKFGWSIYMLEDTLTIPFRINSALTALGHPCMVIDYIIPPSSTYNDEWE